MIVSMVMNSKWIYTEVPANISYSDSINVFSNKTFYYLLGSSSHSSTMYKAAINFLYGTFIADQYTNLEYSISYGDNKKASPIIYISLNN